MQLVIGGAFQGKKDYVKNTFHLEKGEMQDGANASYEDIFSSPCLYHFHQWIRKGLEENWDLENLEIKLLEKKSPDHPDLQRVGIRSGTYRSF